MITPRDLDFQMVTPENRFRTVTPTEFVNMAETAPLPKSTTSIGRFVRQLAKPLISLIRLGAPVHYPEGERHLI